VRVAVISDIHANGQALQAVLADVDGSRVDELWCLGDVVGYGPDPNGCCAIVRERAALCLVGNHDLAALGAVGTEDFNAEAAAATEWTRAQLDDESRAFLSGLEPQGARDGVELFHASPLDPVWDYVLTYQGALLALEATTAPLVLVGHTHVPIAMALEGGAAGGGHAVAGTVTELGGTRRLLNPGSVGQPRDGDPRAAWLLLDLDAGTAGFRRVGYPVAETQAAMHAAGLPPALAQRLEHGL
jgi:diadenosine tetraphosphatase ApaH/serine/threonine PP2A family protein phosphatase